MLDGLADLASRKVSKPADADMIRYVFFTNGIDETQFNKCSLPYILKMMAAQQYTQEQEDKANKRASRR